MLVEQVRCYDHDGRPHELLLVDGAEVQLTVYKLDPDDRLLRRDRAAEWLTRQDTIAATASPVAGALIRLWARQTAEHGAVEDPNGDLCRASDLDDHQQQREEEQGET